MQPDDHPILKALRGEEDNYPHLLNWMRSIYAQDPAALGNPLRFDPMDPDGWQRLAEMAGDKAAVEALAGQHQSTHWKLWKEEAEKRVAPRTLGIFFQSIMEQALERDDREAVRWLLSIPEMDVNTPVPGKHGKPILCRVSSSMRPAGMVTQDQLSCIQEVYAALLSKGADFGCPDPRVRQNTQLHTLIANESIFALPLVKAGELVNLQTIGAAKPCNFDLQDDSGKTALRMAVVADAEKVVKALLEAGASTQSADKHGITVLHCACARGNPRVVEMLLNAGADPFACDGEGKMPFDYLFCEDPLRTMLEEVNIDPDRPFDAPCNLRDCKDRPDLPLRYAVSSIRNFDPPKTWPGEIASNPDKALWSATSLLSHCLRGHEEAATLIIAGAAKKLVEENAEMGDGALQENLQRLLCITKAGKVNFMDIWKMQHNPFAGIGI